MILKKLLLEMRRRHFNSMIIVLILFTFGVSSIYLSCVVLF